MDKYVIVKWTPKKIQNLVVICEGNNFGRDFDWSNGPLRWSPNKSYQANQNFGNRNREKIKAQNKKFSCDYTCSKTTPRDII